MKARVRNVLSGNAVTLLFVILCIGSILCSGQPLGYIVKETVARISRNAVLSFITDFTCPLWNGIELQYCSGSDGGRDRSGDDHPLEYRRCAGYAPRSSDCQYSGRSVWIGSRKTDEQGCWPGDDYGYYPGLFFNRFV